jgi:hypothetical protein
MANRRDLGRDPARRETDDPFTRWQSALQNSSVVWQLPKCPDARVVGRMDVRVMDRTLLLLILAASSSSPSPAAGRRAT